MPGEHLSPTELAARLGVALRTIYDMNYRGTGPRYFRTGTSPGGLVRYRLSDVLAWEREQTVDRDREATGRAS
jgi:predicted DNA-binding transcriptional regulator AlpA